MLAMRQAQAPMRLSSEEEEGTQEQVSGRVEQHV